MNTRLSLVCLSVLWLVGCGGGDSPTGPSGPAPAPPFNQTVTGTVSAFGSTRHSLAIAKSGNMTLRLTWNDPSADLDLYLTAPGCTTNLYPMAACGVLLKSDSASGTQETIARSVVNGEQFQIWVDNLHLVRAETYTLTISIP